MVLKITLDTNCIINLYEKGDTATSVAELEALCSRASSGEIDIAVTTRLPADLRNDKDADRRSRILRLSRQFPKLGTIVRLGFSSLGSGDVLASSDDVNLAQEIQEMLFPNFRWDTRTTDNKLNDVDHLVGHVVNQRDIFVTDDTGILDRRSGLLRLSPHLKVMSPSNCLKEIESGS